MKKIISVAAAVSIAAGMLTGCGEKKNETLKVRVWSAEGATKSFMTEKVDEFNRTTGAEKGINIEYQVIASNMSDMAKSAFENNDGPELVGCSFNDALQYRKKGYIIPINDLAGGEEYLKTIDYDIPDVSFYAQDGKTYLQPISTVTGGLVYNKDLFKKAGIVDENGEALPPKTWDEFVEDAKKIHDMDKTKYGTAFPMKDGTVWWCGMGWATSASYNRASYIDLDKQEIVRGENSTMTLDIMMRVKADNSCFPGSESLDNDTMRLQFAEGNIGMFLGCSWDVGVLTDQFPAKCDWGVAEYPVKNIDERYKQNGMVGGTLSIGNSAVKTEEMSKAVMEVYKFLYSDDMICELYENEFAVPYNTKIADKADTSKISPQWKAFCDMMKVTREPVEEIKYKIEGDSANVVNERVWMGQISIKEASDDINKRTTDALKKGLADGSIDPEVIKKNQSLDYRIK